MVTQWVSALMHGAKVCDRHAKQSGCELKNELIIGASTKIRHCKDSGRC